VNLVKELVHRPSENKLRAQNPCGRFILQLSPLVFLVSHHCCADCFHVPHTRSSPHRKRRDEMSHNIFLMLQECNKFREHQAREVLIELMEKQFKERRGLLKEMQLDIARADELLGSQALEPFMDESS
jgi:hypothetical protein